jgi:hypothetical protein
MFWAAWLRAFELGELVLTFPTKSARDRAKFSLYNSVRRKAELPANVEAAYQNCNLVLVDDTTINLRRFDRDPALTDIMAQIGAVANPSAGLGTIAGAVGHVPTPSELAASTEALEQRLAGDTPPSANPFYSRE